MAMLKTGRLPIRQPARHGEHLASVAMDPGGLKTSTKR